ncbi:SDS, partial [Linum perenne]
HTRALLKTPTDSNLSVSHSFSHLAILALRTSHIFHSLPITNFHSNFSPFELTQSKTMMKLRSGRKLLPKMTQPAAAAELPRKFISKKKTRTQLPRRLRSRISPVLFSSSNSADIPIKKRGLKVAAESGSYQVGDEVSAAGDDEDGGLNQRLRKRKLDQIGGEEQRIEPAPVSRRIGARKQKEGEMSTAGNGVTEVSESSCAASNYVGECDVSVRGTKKLKNGEGESKSVADSEVLVAVQNPAEVKEKGGDGVSGTNSEVHESCMTHKSRGGGGIGALKCSELSKQEADAVSVNESVVVDQRPNRLAGVDDELVCLEHFSCDEVVSDYSSSNDTAFSELQSDMFLDSFSDLDFSSDYTPSIFLDSGSQFSQKSDSDSSPSPTYSCLLEFRRQFCRSSASLPFRTSVETECLDESSYARFKDVDDEQSYQKLRGREKRHIVLHDYVELYRSMTEYGDLITQQRRRMIHWIIEESTAKELHHETTFLGVNLLDRFFSKGMFKSRRNLQIAGLACLTLATRIEENQPYNSVRQRNFYVGNNAYSRCEVVAMEWLVQEVLNFECFFPTVYNFLWFYLKAARADAKVEQRSLNLALLAVSDHEHLQYWPSTIAASVVILACMDTGHTAHYKGVFKLHIRTKENDLHSCVKHFQGLL